MSSVALYTNVLQGNIHGVKTLRLGTKIVVCVFIEVIYIYICLYMSKNYDSYTFVVKIFYPANISYYSVLIWGVVYSSQNTHAHIVQCSDVASLMFGIHKL